MGGPTSTPERMGDDVMASDMILRMAPHGHPTRGMEAIGLSFPDAILSGDPQEAAHVFTDLSLSQATLGVWESEAGVIRFDPYPFDELCIIVEGEVALVPEDTGAAETFRAGDVFLIRESFRGTWHMPRKVRKFYVELKR